MRKYRAGDQVRCLHACYDQFTVGKVYTVGGYYFYQNERLGIWDQPLTPYLGIEKDDQGEANGWPVKYFELAGGPW